MSKISRRSVLIGSSAVVAGSSMFRFAQAAEVILGFDQTKTDWERFKEVRPKGKIEKQVELLGVIWK